MKWELRHNLRTAAMLDSSSWIISHFSKTLRKLELKVKQSSGRALKRSMEEKEVNAKCQEFCTCLFSQSSQCR